MRTPASLAARGLFRSRVLNDSSRVFHAWPFFYDRSSTSAILRRVKLEGGGHVNLAGAVKATVTPGSLVGTMSDETTNLFNLLNSSELLLQGGTIDFGAAETNCGSLMVYAQNASKVTLDGVTVENVHTTVVSGGDTTVVTLQNDTLLDKVAHIVGCGPALLIRFTGRSPSSERPPRSTPGSGSSPPKTSTK